MKARAALSGEDGDVDLGTISGVRGSAPAVLVALLVIGISLAIPRLRDAPSDTGVHPGEIAPAFSLTSFDGRTIALADFRGQPVLLNFWASWCVPCRTEAPILRDAYAREGSQVTFIGVNVRDQEDDARAFLSEFGIPYLNVRDVDGAIEQRYRAPGIPFSVFVGRDGVITRVWIGPIDEELLRKYIEEIR